MKQYKCAVIAPTMKLVRRSRAVVFFLGCAVGAVLLLLGVREYSSNSVTGVQTALLMPGARKPGGRSLALSTKNDDSLPLTRSVTSLKSLLQRLTTQLKCSPRKQYSMIQDNISTITGIDSSRRTGYVLAASFREQQTKASNNLFGLQCWAKTLFVNIVEPFFENSHLVVPLNGTEKNLLKYGDVFDIGVRQLLTAQHKFAPLASWDTFIDKAPRQLIVVRFKYLTSKVYRRRQKDLNTTKTHFAVDSKYKEGCGRNPKFAGKIQYLRAVHNFTIIREVCFNFAEGDQLTLHQFNRHLYEGIGPKTATVVMEEWRGLGSMENGKHVVLFDACLPANYVQSTTFVWPSQKLICDANKYKVKYLGTDGYIALMVRTEKILTLNSSRDAMAYCLNETLTLWKKMKTSTGLEKTFLSMDIGTYGSYTLVEKRDKRYTPFLHLYDHFIKELFGPDATTRTWEETFEAIIAKRDSGYVGSLQKTIAAQAKCTVFSGGGSFQKHAKYMYERVNAKRRKCIGVVHKCSRGL